MRMLLGYIGFACGLAAALIVARELSWGRLVVIAAAFLFAFLNLWVI